MIYNRVTRFTGPIWHLLLVEYGNFTILEW